AIGWFARRGRVDRPLRISFYCRADARRRRVAVSPGRGASGRGHWRRRFGVVATHAAAKPYAVADNRRAVHSRGRLGTLAVFRDRRLSHERAGPDGTECRGR